MLWELLVATHDAQADFTFNEFSELFLKKTIQQLHECIHFIFWAIPIFHAKCIESNDFNAVFLGSFECALDGVSPTTMPLNTGQAAFIRPTPITVHNDGNVLWSIMYCR